MERDEEAELLMGVVQFEKRASADVKELRKFLGDTPPDTGVAVLHHNDQWHVFVLQGPRTLAETIGTLEAVKHDLIQQWNNE